VIGQVLEVVRVAGVDVVVSPAGRGDDDGVNDVRSVGPPAQLASAAR
jgi:hypothetical protein